ncbi:hypothetical protein TWF679_006948 [Orbilia oligospora]|uniref:Uncharacterized protein n=1 Tax=Orbilia oligospora TaxID=2813651 RepID=A0A8H8VKT5_ORBOL|nr:hypothetical protein TWF679_006948 [Orbilia oligospora]
MLQEGGINKRIPVQEINVLKRKIIEAQTLAKQQFTFIEIEPSIGQWSGGDIKHLQEGFQDLFVNGIVLLNFHLLRQEYRSKVQRNAPKDPAVSYPYSFSLNNHKPRKDPYRRNSEAQTLASTAIYEFLKPEPESGKLEQAAFDEMGNLSQDLLDHDAVITSMKIIDSANNRKWFTSPKKSNMDVIVEQHTQALDKLKNQRERFQLRIVDSMIDPASHFFDAEGKFIHSSDGCVKILGLVVGMNYRHRIMAFTASLVNLLEHLIQLESEKSKVKFWMPVALKSLFSVAISPEPVYDDNALEKTQKIFEKKEGKLKGQKEKKGRKEKSTAQRTRGKSAKTYNNRYQQQRPRNKIVRALTSLYHWVTNSDGAFAARVVIATLILTIPGATKPGARFCYDNRVVKFEPSSSPFTCSILLEIETCLSRILESLSTIAFVLPRLTGTYKRILEAQTYFVETETVASIIAALTALEETLRGGQPLSDVLPVPLLQNLRKITMPPNGIGAHEFSRDILKDDDWSSFLVALMAVASLYSRIDSLVITVKEAVGEKYHVEGLLSISPEPIRSGHDIVLSHQV